MKQYLFSFAFLASFPVLSQDIISRHTTGDITAKVVSINENSIVYTYPGETVTNTIGKAAVSRVRFESGRVEEITSRVDVSGRDGWQKVIITSIPAEVVGLTRKGEVKAKAGGYWEMRTTKGADKKATERIKREAAKIGAHVVFIQQHETKGMRYGSNPESIQSGAAYGY